MPVPIGNAAITPSTPLLSAHLVPGTTLPAVHVTGKIQCVWGSVTSKKATVPAVIFVLRHTLVVPRGEQTNDYVLPTEKEMKRRYTLKFDLHHTLWHDEIRPQDEVARQVIRDKVEQNRRWMEQCLKDHGVITISLDGLKVVKVSPGAVYEVHLQGAGERVVRYDDGRIKKLFAEPEPVKPSGPPLWFDGSSPSSLPSTLASDSTSSIPVPALGESSRLRPLTSHQPPDLARIPSRTSSTSSSTNPQITTDTRAPPHAQTGRLKLKRSSPTNEAIVAKRPRVPQSSVEQRLKVITPLNGAAEPGISTSSTTHQHSYQPVQPAEPAQPAQPAQPTQPDIGPRHHASGKTAQQPTETDARSQKVDSPRQDAASSPQEKRTVVQLGPPGWQARIPQPPVSPKDPGSSLLPPLRQGSSTELSSAAIDEPAAAPAEVENIPPASSPEYPPPAQMRRRPSDSGSASLKYKTPRLDQASSSSPSTFPSPSRPRTHLGHAESSPVYPSRRPSTPVVSQSSPLDSSRHDTTRWDARREAEKRARAAALGRQAESSRAAQLREAEYERLKRPFDVNGVSYTPLHEMRKDAVVNVIGVVVDRKEPRKSRDHTISIVLADPSRHAQHESGNEELVVTIFRPSVTDLPTDVERGDVMLFRGMKINLHNDKTKGNCYNDSGRHASNTWVIVKGGRTIKFANEGHMDPPLCQEEVDRIKLLWQWWGSIHGDETSTPFGTAMARTPSSPNRRTSAGMPRDLVTLGEVREGDFFDATFKIMHVQFNKPRKPSLEVYVTDGTRSHSGKLNRNFHGVRFPDIPSDALFCLAIHDEPLDRERDIFAHGKYVKLSNVRAKLYRDEMEFGWSEKLTSEQLALGWRSRRGCQEVDAGDERARVIERRLAALKRGDAIEGPLAGPEQVDREAHQSKEYSLPPIRNVQPGNSSFSSPIIEMEPERVGNPPQLALHLCTTYTSPIDHPTTTISQILTNPTIPNRYRLTARVKSVHPRGNGNGNGIDTLVQPHCKHCSATFRGNYCMSCNDVEGTNAEYRYRFVVLLEDVDESGRPRDQMAVLVADDEAAKFLPALPPYSTTTSPPELRRNHQRLQSISAEAYSILQGAKMDGVRPRPLIDLSVEVYEVDKPRSLNGLKAGSGNRNGNVDGDRGVGAGVVERVAVARLFGMKSVL